MKEPKQLLRAMVDTAYSSRILSSNAPPRIGKCVERLKPEQRELLKQLRSDDIKDDRWPRVPEFHAGHHIY